MKKFITFSTFILISFCAFAQAPEKFSYQAVIRNSSGELASDQDVGMKISILEGSTTGAVVYQEIFNPNPHTNVNGLVTIEIGGGIPLTGNFSTINWSSGSYYLKTETDPAGGTNYSITGTSPLISVPYALYAKKSGETDPVWTAASANYYTKSNMQTATQAQLHWNNLTSVDADILDLADGSLTGSKVGAGIPVANISGLGSLAVLSTVGSGQITDGSVTSADIADNTITTADVSSIGADKISGISNSIIPRSNGSSLVNGSIFDLGTYVGIGAHSSGCKLMVESLEGKPYAFYARNGGNNVLNYAIYGSAYSASNINYGVYGNATGTTGNYNYGIYGNASSSSTGVAHAYGAVTYSTGTGTDNRGIYALAYNGGTNYGIYAVASGGTTNWAGYFLNDVFLGDEVRAPNLSSAAGTALVVDASGWIRRLSSDARLKENISPLFSSLEKVMKLEGVSFNWKSDGSPDIGFVAQDVQKVIPELVITDSNDGTLSVKYLNMIALLTEAIKEQQSRIEEQQKEIDELKRQVKGWKSRNNSQLQGKR
jgi:hypothetical protein